MEQEPLDDVDLFFRSVQQEAVEQRRKAGAIEAAWNGGIGQELADASERVRHADTESIFTILEDTGSLPQSVALFILNEDVPTLSQAMRETDSSLPSGLIENWYGHASAALLAVDPPLIETEEGAILPDEQLFSEVSFPTLSRYDASTTTESRRRIQSLLQYDPTGVEAVVYVASDSQLQEARMSTEKYPQIAESVVRLGVTRYAQLMHRMLQEVDPRYHPGAEDREELSDDAVHEYQRTMVHGIWKDEVKPNMIRWHQEPLNPQTIQSAATLIQNGHNPYRVIHAGMQEEMRTFQDFYEEQVATTFPKDIIPRAYLIPVLSLVQAQTDSDGARSGAAYTDIVRREMGIDMPKGAIAAGIKERVAVQTSLLGHMHSLLKEDASGFQALEFFVANEDYQTVRTRGASYPDTNEDILALGVARYRQWYHALAENGSVPYPPSLDGKGL